MNIAAALGFLALCFTHAAIAAPPLSDSAAREILAKVWSEPWIQVPLGRSTVVSGRPDPSNKIISEEQFKDIVAFEKLGLVTLKTEEVLSEQKKFSWKDWQDRTQSGILYRIEVTSTPKGIQEQRDSNLSARISEDVLAVKFMSRKIEKIVRNEDRKKGADELRIVMGTRQIDVSSLGAQYFALRQRYAPPRDKFVALLRFDPFESRWKIVAADVAPLEKDFATNNVNSRLGN